MIFKEIRVNFQLFKWLSCMIQPLMFDEQESTILVRHLARNLRIRVNTILLLIKPLIPREGALSHPWFHYLCHLVRWKVFRGLHFSVFRLGSRIWPLFFREITFWQEITFGHLGERTLFRPVRFLNWLIIFLFWSQTLFVPRRIFIAFLFWFVEHLSCYFLGHILRRLLKSLCIFRRNLLGQCHGWRLRMTHNLIFGTLLQFISEIGCFRSIYATTSDWGCYLVRFWRSLD